MTLSNGNVELKLTWTKHCVLARFGVANDGADYNNTIFTIKDTKRYVLVASLSSKDSQNLFKLLRKGFERSVYFDE